MTGDSGGDGEGRKRRLSSEQVAANILDAAIEVFASQGWAGFSFESISRAAGVGKSSLYSRYRSRDEIMAQIIETHLFDGAGIGSNDIEADLRDLARAYADWLDGPGGRLSLRFFLEDRLNDDFRTVWIKSQRPQLATRSLYGLIDRAKDRGQLDASVESGVVLHSLLGGVVQQLAASRAPSGTVFTSAEGQQYLDDLVASVLRASRPSR